MIVNGAQFLKLFLALTLMTSCDVVRRANDKAREINRFEVAALNLSKKNRALKAKMSKVQFEVQELKSKNKFLNIEIRNLVKKL